MQISWCNKLNVLWTDYLQEKLTWHGDSNVFIGDRKRTIEVKPCRAGLLKLRGNNLNYQIVAKGGF